MNEELKPCPFCGSPAMPASESAAAFAVPRHEYEISANVARHIQAAGRREAARLDRQEA